MEQIGPHLLGIKGLKRDQIEFILDTAQQFCEVNQRQIKKVPTLRGKTIINLFLEASTRTRTSFEIAAKRLSADAINVGAKDSSVSKGESLVDTVLTLQSMNPEIVVMRHAASGAPHFVSRYLKDAVIINAGDGLHEHPTQALLDALSIKQRLGRLDNLKIVLVGDILRGRVARSNILLHKIFGNKICAVGPSTLIPRELKDLGVEYYYDLPRALEGADVVMSLRMKFEYLKEAFIPNIEEYTRRFMLSEPILQRYAPNSIVLAPGPFYRGIEMTSEVIDGPRSLVSAQVNNGVAVRMAILYLLAQQQGYRYAQTHGQKLEEIRMEESA